MFRDNRYAHIKAPWRRKYSDYITKYLNIEDNQVILDNLAACRPFLQHIETKEKKEMTDEEIKLGYWNEIYDKKVRETVYINELTGEFLLQHQYLERFPPPVVVVSPASRSKAARRTIIIPPTGDTADDYDGIEVSKQPFQDHSVQENLAWFLKKIAQQQIDYVAYLKNKKYQDMGLTLLVQQHAVNYVREATSLSVMENLKFMNLTTVWDYNELFHTMRVTLDKKLLSQMISYITIIQSHREQGIIDRTSFKNPDSIDALLSYYIDYHQRKLNDFQDESKSRPFSPIKPLSPGMSFRDFSIRDMTRTPGARTAKSRQANANNHDVFITQLSEKPAMITNLNLICTFLYQDIAITHIILSHRNITHLSYYDMMHISSMKGLIYLDLSYNAIDDDGLHYLIVLLKFMKPLQTLILTGNKLTPIGIGKLLETVQQHHHSLHLSKLELSKNRLCDEDIGRLDEMLKIPKVTISFGLNT